MTQQSQNEKEFHPEKSNDLLKWAIENSTPGQKPHFSKFFMGHYS